MAVDENSLCAARQLLGHHSGLQHALAFLHHHDGKKQAPSHTTVRKVDAHRFISQHMKRKFSPWRPPLARTHAQAAWWAPGSAWPAPPAGRRWPPGSSSGLLSTKQGRGGWVANNSMCSFSFFIGIFFNLKTKQLVFLIHWCDDDDDLKVYKWEVNR